MDHACAIAFGIIVDATSVVIPAQAGTQGRKLHAVAMGSRLRGNDEVGCMPEVSKCNCPGVTAGIAVIAARRCGNGRSIAALEDDAMRVLVPRSGHRHLVYRCRRRRGRVHA